MRTTCLGQLDSNTLPPFDQARTPPDQAGKATDGWHGGISNGRINDVLATRRYTSGDDLEQMLKLLLSLVAQLHEIQHVPNC